MQCVLCIFLIYSNIYIDSTKAVSKFVEIGGILPYVEAIKSKKKKKKSNKFKKNLQTK